MRETGRTMVLERRVRGRGQRVRVRVTVRVRGEVRGRSGEEVLLVS